MRDIAEILDHWQAGRSICAISRSLGVCRATVRKYVYAAEARGYRHAILRELESLRKLWGDMMAESVQYPTKSKHYPNIVFAK